MKVNYDLILNRRNIESKKRLRRLSQETQILGLIALLKKLKESILHYRPWAEQVSAEIYGGVK